MRFFTILELNPKAPKISFSFIQTDCGKYWILTGACSDGKYSAENLGMFFSRFINKPLKKQISFYLAYQIKQQLNKINQPTKGYIVRTFDSKTFINIFETKKITTNNNPDFTKIYQDLLTVLNNHIILIDTTVSGAEKLHTLKKHDIPPENFEFTSNDVVTECPTSYQTMLPVLQQPVLNTRSSSSLGILGNQPPRVRIVISKNQPPFAILVPTSDEPTIISPPQRSQAQHYDAFFGTPPAPIAADSQPPSNSSTELQTKKRSRTQVEQEEQVEHKEREDRENMLQNDPRQNDPTLESLLARFYD